MNFNARYYGKGMRIDYTLVDKRLVENVKRSEIHGKDRHGFVQIIAPFDRIRLAFT